MNMSAIEHPSPSRRYFVTDTVASMVRVLRKTVRNPFALFFSLVQPIIWLILFSEIFQAVVEIPGFEVDNYLAFLTSAIIIMVALFASTASGIGLVFDMEYGVFDKLLASPMNRSGIFLGKTLAETIIIAGQVLLILVIALFMGASIETGFAGALGIVAFSVFFGIGFVALSNIIGLATKSADVTIIAAQFLALPLLFLSTAFLPAEFLPGWVESASVVNPVTYGIEPVRALMLEGWMWETLIESALVLGLFNLVVGVLAVSMLRRATSSVS